MAEYIDSYPGSVPDAKNCKELLIACGMSPDSEISRLVFMQVTATCQRSNSFQQQLISQKRGFFYSLFFI